jgi:phage repressor protein C with HTH and peptisase S24 domain
MLKIIKVAGESLSPLFLPGDYVLVRKYTFLFGSISEGDIVIFTHPSYGLMIKEIYRVNSELQQIRVKGSHPLSVNSSKIGPIASANILGKVIWHIKKPRLST